LLEEVFFDESPGPPYTRGALGSFLGSLQLPPRKTPFAAKVIHAARSLPPGRTATYRELAIAAGSPGSARAVGQVMARNNIALVIPCHRIVPASGGWGGYRWGEDRKAELIRIERETGKDAWRVL